MLETNTALVNLHFPLVIEERNKLIVMQIGKELDYGTDKMQKLFSELSRLSGDPRRVLECLYMKLWSGENKYSRDDIQNIINRCHEEAFEWFQEAYPELLVG